MRGARGSATAERASATRTAPEAVIELRPPRPLAEVVAGVLVPASTLRRDVEVAASALDVAEGHVRLGRAWHPLRPLAARQLRALAGVSAQSPSVELRRALAARGSRRVLARLDGDVVRAMLGIGFVPLDDVVILSRIASAIESMGWRSDLVARLIATSDAITIVRLTLRRSRLEPRPGDAFERGIEITNSETGLAAFSLRPLVWRSGCFNFSIAAQPTLRLIHAGSAHRVERDLRKDLAHALDGARSLLGAWRASPAFDLANEISGAAKERSLAGRIAEERRAQQLVQDAAHHRRG